MKILMKLLIILAIFTSSKVLAETTLTPYFSLGVYHKDCAMSAEILCEYEFGSDTPGTIDLGVRLETDKPKWYFLYVDEVDIGWHHQSYVDRGRPFGGPETFIDMYGARFTWTIDSLKIRF